LLLAMGISVIVWLPQLSNLGSVVSVFPKADLSM